MMDHFAAIDFETANEQPSSVCSVGIVIVRYGIPEQTIYRLIRPEPDYYLYRNTMIHGLSAIDTDNARVFSHVWKEIEPFIQDLPLVAHNAQFDEGCLKAAFFTYCMDYPDYEFFLHPSGVTQALWKIIAKSPVTNRCSCLRA